MTCLSDMTAKCTNAHWLALLALLCLAAMTGPSWAATPCDDGTLIYCEDFEGFPVATGAPGGWTLAQGPQDRAGVGEQTSNSPTKSLYQRGNNVRTESPVIDLSGQTNAQLTFWVSRGHSPDTTPSASVPLTVEYLNANGNWIKIDEIPGGFDVREFFRVHTLPQDAFHANMQIAFQHPTGACQPGGSYTCYWHIDDITIGEPQAVELLVNGQPEQWTIEEGDTADFEASAFDCDPSGQQWRDSWDFGEGTTTQTVFADSACNRTPITDNHVYPSTGTYQVTFTSEYCTDWSGGSCVGTWVEHGSDTVTVVVDPPSVSLNAVYEFYMDEEQWSGISGEVEDSSGNNLNGTSSGPTTDDTDRARPGDPGTCHYGDFSSGGYVTAPGTSLVNDADSFSIAAWINTPDGDQTSTYPAIMAYGNTQGDNFAERWELYLDRSSFPEDWVLAVRKDNGNIEQLRVEVDPYSSTDPLDGNWVHVAASFDAPNNEATLYLNGQEAGSDKLSGKKSLADSTGDLGLFAHPNGAFDAVGWIDEPRVFTGVLAASDVDILYQQTRPCNEVAYYELTHPGSGITCASTPVTVEAFDVNDNPVEPSPGTAVTLSSDTGGGYWSTLLGGSGVFNSGSDGAATYEYPGNESAFQVGYDYTAIGSDPASVTPTATDGDGNGSVANTISISRAGFRFIDRNTGTATIPFQVAGKPSDMGYSADDIGLQAVRESDDDPTTCEGVYADGATAAVGLAAECRDPATCGTEQVTVNGNAIATSDDNGDNTSASAYTDVNLTFGPNSTAPLSLNYFDVGEIDLYAAAEIQRADSSGSGDFMTGSSNDFVWRPFGFLVTSPAIQGLTVGPGGAVFGAAGDDFTVDVTAVTWDSADDADNDGKPDEGSDLSSGNTVTSAFGSESQQSVSVTLSAKVSAPATGNDGGLSNSSLTAFNNGTDQLTTNWSEVGYVDLVAELGAAYLGTEIVHGRGEDAGRFIPHHFTAEVTPNNPKLATGCDINFSYLGQPTGYATDPVVTIVPRNKPGNKTTNYDDFTADGEGNWWKLQEIVASYTETSPDKHAEIYLDDGAANQPNDGTAPNGPAQVEITFSGELSHAFNTGQAPDVEPFTAQPQISFDVEDADNVVLQGGNPFEIDLGYEGSAQIRHGRLNIGNAHGSELLDLKGNVVTEYYVDTAGGWQASAGDGCTGNDEDVALMVSSTTGAVAAGDTCIIEPGDQSGMGCNGSSDASKDWTEPPTDGDFNAWFRAPTGGATGSLEIVPSNMPGWLEYDWTNSDNHDDLPSGVITFGIYEGHQRRIDLRETW